VWKGRDLYQVIGTVGIGGEVFAKPSGHEFFSL
jgi:hypothetical protein